MKTFWPRLFATALVPIALFVLWYLVSDGSSNFFFPPLRKILAAFGKVWLNAGGFSDIVVSLWRLAVGFLVSLIFSLVVGVVLGLSKAARDYTEPVFEFFRAIPPTVMIPVLLVVSGIGDASKIAVISFGCLWPMLLNTIEGVRSIDPVLKDTCRVYRIHGLRRLFSLTLPAAAPQIVTGMRTGLSIAIILMVISEMFASRNGMGFMIIQFQRTFSIPEMWSGILLLGLIGVLLSLLMRVVELSVLGWYERSRIR
ncbi:MAG TPA: ABC transporter permease [Castellaniella sp.]|jgi:ABC-type nitrate/sulfonate/bicarbonate transport system permease component|nr:ABC transporter permease [Castellaniella sp.]